MVRRRGASLSAWLAAAIVYSGACAAQSDVVARGEYMFHASLCAVCHTAEEGEFLAGGRPLASPFGTFYSPNITPHHTFGIGGWSAADFLQAMRHGIAPDGSHYYPAFPYTAYTRLRDDDILAIKAYLDTVKPVAEPNRPHDLAWYVWRWPLAVWKWVFFEPGAFQPDPQQTERWNRGAYLAEAAAHCDECHTPRNLFGALDEGLRYVGAPLGPEGESTPNITPHNKSGIGSWSVDMLSFYLEIGMTPDGDFAGSLMAKVIDKGTAKLTAADREAIAAYILSLPPALGEP